MVKISEAAFESAIEATLLAGGPADEIRETPTLPFGAESFPGGYRRRTPGDYDRHLCLLPQSGRGFRRPSRCLARSCR